MGLVYTNPLVLTDLSPEILKFIDSLLPYSTGFEIECSKSKTFDINEFKNIPDIMDVNISGAEQRFRIPNGLKGLQCLYNISCKLKKNSLLNLGSGIHYHIDFTDKFEDYNQINSLINNFHPYILQELASWGYKGKYNNKDVSIGGHTWVRFNTEFKTFEFRIGEMTFDYNLLLERIIHCNKIIKYIKDGQELIKAKILRDRLDNLKKQLKDKQEDEISEDEIARIVRERRING